MIYNFIIYTFSLYYDSSMDLKIIVQVPFYKYKEQCRIDFTKWEDDFTELLRYLKKPVFYKA